VDFDETGLPLIIYSAFVKYLRKNGNTMNQCISSCDSLRREVLNKNLFQFGIPMKLARPIKMCLSETYSRFCVGKNLCDRFVIRNGLKQGDALSSLLFIGGFR
jgi:hypothetical protein